MRAVLVLIAVIVSGAAVAQTQGETGAELMTWHEWQQRRQRMEEYLRDLQERQRLRERLRYSEVRQLYERRRFWVRELRGRERQDEVVILDDTLAPQYQPR
jgi:hypothetical protein